MGITVSGLGSGLDYDSWIEALVAIKQKDIDKVTSKVTSIEDSKTTLSSVEKSYSSLLSSIETFTTTISKNNVFNQKSVASSNSAVTAEVTAYAKVQNIDVTVSQLATSTVAKSASNVTSYIDSETKVSAISNGSITEGNFSIYINGAKHTVAVTKDTTMGSLINTINDSSDFNGVTASLSSDGKLTIASDNTSTYKVTLGSSSDTSNFLNKMAMAGSNSTFTSNKSLSETNTSGTLTGTTYANGTITEGSFTIGNATFKISSTSTIDSVINEINKSTDAGATAYWDSTAGRLVLTSTDGGATNINLAAGSATDAEAASSNFLHIMGLTESDGKTLADNTQTLGQNAIFTVNGTQIISSSNTVTSDVTGITGLTLTLNSATTSAAKVSITNDTSKVAAALQSFVDSLNSVISGTDEATSSTGDLYGESILKSIKNKVRTLTTSKMDGLDSTYNVLAKIGITTDVTTNSDKSKTTKFVLNTDTLNSALKDNSDAVSELLVGNGTADGVLDKLQTVVKDTLDVSDGYFTTKEKSYKKQVSRYEDKIERMNTALASYKVTLQKKFSAMDTLISSLKNGASVFDSYFNNSNKSS